jgi:hypothetical protein
MARNASSRVSPEDMNPYGQEGLDGAAVPALIHYFLSMRLARVWCPGSAGAQIFLWIRKPAKAQNRKYGNTQLQNAAPGLILARVRDFGRGQLLEDSSAEACRTTLARAAGSQPTWAAMAATSSAK